MLLFAPADGWRDLLPGAAGPRPGGSVRAAAGRRRGRRGVRPRPARRRWAGRERSSGRRRAARRARGVRRPACCRRGRPGCCRAWSSATRGPWTRCSTRTSERAGLSHLTAVSGANVAIVLTGGAVAAAPAGRRPPGAGGRRRARRWSGSSSWPGRARASCAPPPWVRSRCSPWRRAPARRAARPGRGGLRAAAPRSGAGPGRRLRPVGGRHRSHRPARARLVAGGCGPAGAGRVAGRRARGERRRRAWPPRRSSPGSRARSAWSPCRPTCSPRRRSRPATVLGLVAAVVGPVGPVRRRRLVWLAGWPTRWLVLVAERAAAVPDAATGWPAGAGGAVLLTVAAPARWPGRCGASPGCARWRWPRWSGWSWSAGRCGRRSGAGRRRSARRRVRRRPGRRPRRADRSGAGVLVDAGPDVGAVDRCLDRLGIDALPLVLHVPPGRRPRGRAGRGAGRSRDRGRGHRHAVAVRRARGRVRGPGPRAGGEREVLVPGDRRTVGRRRSRCSPGPGRATAAAEANDLSMVVRVTQRGVRILFTGDLSAQAEARILASGVDLRGGRAQGAPPRERGRRSGLPGRQRRPGRAHLGRGGTTPTGTRRPGC